MPRSKEGLRAARRALFDALPISSDCLALMSFQRQVVEEILQSEAERGDSPAIGRHIHAVRSYGDCLAFQHLSTYALRQLRRNSGKPPDLSGQGAAFKLPLDLCAAANEAGVPAILCDATNVLRTGDVVLCQDRDLPAIIECKASQRAPDPRFLHQGRRGRQLARIEKVTEFLRTGEGRLFGDSRLRRTIELKHVPQFDFAPVDRMVIRRGDIKVVAAVPRPAGVEADTTWVYCLDVQDERMFVSPSALYHMAYGHETLESCRERILETAEWTVKFDRSGDEAAG